jgi:hypothetical protein
MPCSFESGGEKDPRLEFGRLRAGISYQVRVGKAIGGLWKDVQKMMVSSDKEKKKI